MKKAILFLAALLLLGGCSPDPEEKIERELVSFSNSTSIHGDFFLGIGSIDGVDVYRYLYKHGENGIRQGKFPTLISTVYEKYGENTNEGKVVITCQTPPMSFRCDCSRRWEIPGCFKSVDFYIPKGSVNRKFTLDFKND
jgi:hypothetical protein